MILEWEPIPGTQERQIRNRNTGQVLTFTDGEHAPEQEYPRYGLDELFSPEDLDRLTRQYTSYELASGGA